MALARLSAVAALMIVLWAVPAFAGNDAVPSPDQPDEHGICIPTTPLGWHEACDGPDPPEYCNEYDPDYGDWFVPEQGGIFEILRGGMKHVYTD